MTEKEEAVMLFDGECAFCRRWVERWRRLTGDKVRYAPYQRELAAYPQLTEKQCEEAVQLVTPDGAVYSGARAVFKALALGGRASWPLALYERVPLAGPFFEFCYRLVAGHRSFFSRFYR
jgi:predicted DCC family thiol-disulfide oxidoreductase YuxK